MTSHHTPASASARGAASPGTPGATGTHVSVDGVSASFGTRRVLTDITFTVTAGRPTGLIGENGSGKSTLLRIMAGLHPPDAGTVRSLAAHGAPARVALLHQQPPFAPGDTVAEAVDAAVRHVREASSAVDDAARALAAAPHDERVSERYAAALETAERTGAWDVDSTIGATLDGLGLGGVGRDRRAGELSGGQRARLSLAWTLLRAPDVLLLDEPTNHLDDSAIDFLSATLRSWPGPVLLASHDRAFLDATVGSLVDLDPAPRAHAATADLVGDGTGTGIGVTRFSGTYSQYVLARLEERERWERTYRDEQAQLKKLRAAVREQQSVGHANWSPRSETRMAKKFYADRNATAVSRRVNDARTRLATLKEEQVRRPPQELFFRGLTAAARGSGRELARTGPVLSASHAAVAGRLAPVDLTIGAGEKWLLTGANGAGKSTLLGLLAGVCEPTDGAVHRAPGVHVRLLGQEDSVAHAAPERTASRVYRDLVGAEFAETVPLATFGLLAGRDENRPVGELSVGQRRRLALAALLADPPHVLLLDEPTNHVSLVLATQLEAAVPEYPGTVVVASHDRWLRRTWNGRHLRLEAPAA
ncbi:ABC-F family ATP-binding cassette domain-containing protein [Kocuria rhizophila]|uniref:ABC-F family ATP-binding cassette domain-containing protein n=1 Tax=Kocuria rhizophila TaxID=72000 RepID=UPI001E09B32A|nr:ATP-binding cassette domain-containing protein [Kocuria rhizophila]MCC5673774.1 ABC-F family ATP-binding cassette domain-containing protein [Kocuria rhizophila]